MAVLSNQWAHVCLRMFSAKQNSARAALFTSKIVAQEYNAVTVVNPKELVKVTETTIGGDDVTWVI